MDIFGEHPSIRIGVAILIAIYLGACRAAGRRPTRRQAMWFAVAMGAILYAHSELDELADARIFSMHMLQHLMQTFVIPPLLLLGTPGYTFGLGFMVRQGSGVAAVPGSPGEFMWAGWAGTFFWVDPKEELVAVYMSQAPSPVRAYYRRLVKQLVYQAIVD